MKADEAWEKMKEFIQALSKKFNLSGVKAVVEADLLDKKMNTIDSISKAKYLNVSLVLKADGKTECEEYCMTLGAEISHGSVSDSLYRDMAEYEQLVNQNLTRLSNAENKSEAINALIKESEGELDNILSDIKDRRRKKIITSLISALAICAVIGLLVFISLGAGG